MRRRSLTALAVVFLLSMQIPLATRAELCTIDTVPAATLLLPHFALDLDRASQPDTVFTINNASASPAVAQVTLWTDASVPELTFGIFLTGFDLQTISLRQLFLGDIQFDPECFGPAANILGPASDQKAAQLGRTELAYRFVGRAKKRAVATGYITIDNVNDCTTIFPSDDGYFVDGGTGVASNFNQLWGEVFVVSKKLLAANRLVSIEAGDDPIVSTPGNYTFYGRYLNFSAADNREPLRSTWAARYFTEGREKTYFQVWRESRSDEPLTQSLVIAFDDQEGSVEVGFDPPEDFFPNETQEVRVGRGLDTPFSVGWFFLNLNSRDDEPLQSFVTIRQDVRARRGTYDAMPHYDEQSGQVFRETTLCGPAPTANGT